MVDILLTRGTDLHGRINL